MSAAEAIIGIGPVADEERPAVIMRVGHGGYASVSNQIVTLVEIGVIHGHGAGVGSALVNQGEAAIAKISTCPGAVRMEEWCAIVLRSTDAEIAVGGMH